MPKMSLLCSLSDEGIRKHDFSVYKILKEHIIKKDK